jgi:aspartyl-tRNA(Asn)/glutamyl-tRNA(Gln) amidotransferase subunit B
MARYYEAARDACKQPKLVANWLMGEVSKRLNEGAVDISASPVSPWELAGIITRIQDSTLSDKLARHLLDSLWTRAGPQLSQVTLVAGSFEDLDEMTRALAEIDGEIAAKGLKQMSDSSALEKIVDDVLAANAKSVEEFRAGKDKAFNALVGQVMKASKGQANPTQASDLLKKKLGAG